uniref:Uncharacterized protein n=1 Tax=Rhizophora mucronata TaxID=61149 RepID=A0A2P2IN21_RHIMU
MFIKVEILEFCGKHQLLVVIAWNQSDYFKLVQQIFQKPTMNGYRTHENYIMISEMAQ